MVSIKPRAIQTPSSVRRFTLSQAKSNRTATSGEDVVLDDWEVWQPRYDYRSLRAYELGYIH